MRYLRLYPDFTSMNNVVETVFNGNIKTLDKVICIYDDQGYPLTKKSPDGALTVMDLRYEFVVK